jgi:hypothetical protein
MPAAGGGSVKTLAINGRLVLEPGDACGPPPEVLNDIIWNLSSSDIHWVLVTIAVYYPEVFEEALLNLAQFKQRTRVRAAAAAQHVAFGRRHGTTAP